MASGMTTRMELLPCLQLEATAWQAASDLKRAVTAYNDLLREGKELGLECHAEMKELWKEWDEDVEGTGQVHPAILNNDLGVDALFLAWQVYKILIWDTEWSGGSKKDEEVYTILLTTPQYHK